MISRREMLCRSGMGMGALAFGALFEKADAQQSAPLNPLAPKPPQFRGRARHVIHLFANGGPSHLDTSIEPSSREIWGNPGSTET
jgi:hypothetical protein